MVPFLFKLFLIAIFYLTAAFPAKASFATESLGLEVSADRADCLYELGDTAVFSITLKNPGVSSMPYLVEYRLTEDGERVIEEGTLDISNGRAELRGSLEVPGFLRADITLNAGKNTLKKACACGFEPLAIRPTNVLPEDFDTFWRQGRAELLRVPMDVRLEPAPEKKVPGAKVYRIDYANIENTRLYGWLTVPEGRGPFPAVLSLPGAGVGEHGPGSGYAEAGMVVLTFNIHGIETGKSKEYQDRLRSGPLKDYPQFGGDNPYRYYYRRVILGSLRALDYLTSREDVDTTRLVVSGSSQGGALSLLVAGLDSRVKALTANVPAMCDHTGSLHGRPSGWPRLIKRAATPKRAQVLRTSGYYDAALCAGFIKVPALVAVGFIDRVCPPTSVYAAYNNLKGPKEIDNFPAMGHAHGPGWLERRVEWLIDTLGWKK